MCTATDLGRKDVCAHVSRISASTSGSAWAGVTVRACVSRRNCEGGCDSACQRQSRDLDGIPISESAGE